VKHTRTLLAALTALGLLLPAASAAEGQAPAKIDHEKFAPFTFAHFGDPQMGFGIGGLAATRDRFVQAIESAQSRKAEVACVAGDLVHNRTEPEYAALEEAWKSFAVPVLVVPGNHDVADPATLARFRKRYGRDYGAATWRNCEFLLLDSMLLSAAAPWYKPHDDAHAAEVTKQWAWLEQALQAARDKKRTHIFVVIHVPPFLGKPQEKAGYGNLPADARQRLLDLARKYKVSAILAGHCHSTREIPVPEGPTIYTAGGTARTDAKAGFGYRLFHVRQDGLTQEFIKTAPMPGKKPAKAKPKPAPEPAPEPATK